MTLRSLPRPPHNPRSGFILYEAVLAAAFSGIVLAVITPLFANQFKLAQQARDLDLVEAAVTEDINAIRHQARFWRLTSQGPYSPSIHTGTGPSASSTALIYSPENSCETWGTNRGGLMEKSFTSDLGQYKRRFPGAVDITDDPRSITQVAGYTIQRESDYPTSSTSASQVLAASANNPTTLRLYYSVFRTADRTPAPFAFNRVVDIQVNAQFWC